MQAWSCAAEGHPPQQGIIEFEMLVTGLEKVQIEARLALQPTLFRSPHPLKSPEHHGMYPMHSGKSKPEHRQVWPKNKRSAN